MVARKRILSYCLLCLLVASLVSLLFVEVVNANPYSFNVIDPPPNPKMPSIEILYPINNSIYHTNQSVTLIANIGKPNSSIYISKVYIICNWQTVGARVIIPSQPVRNAPATTQINVEFNDLPEDRHIILIHVEAYVISEVHSIIVYYYNVDSPSLVYFSVQNSETSSFSPTPISTPSPSPTPLPSLSPTSSPSSSLIPTSTPIPSPTPTITPTQEPTQTFSPTPTPAPSLTQQETLEPSPILNDNQNTDFTPAIIPSAIIMIAVAVVVLVCFKKKRGLL